MPVDFEKLGVFYLGREFDPERGEIPERPVLYDAPDLTPEVDLGTPTVSLVWIPAWKPVRVVARAMVDRAS
jgi:hypothetical protein